MEEQKIVMQANGLPCTVKLKAGHQMFRRSKITDPSSVAYVQLPTKVCATRQGRGLVISAPKNTEFTFIHVSDFVGEQVWYNRQMGLTLGVAPPSALVVDPPITERAGEEKPKEGEKGESIPSSEIEIAGFLKENSEREKPMTIKEILAYLSISRNKYYKCKKLNEDG